MFGNVKDITLNIICYYVLSLKTTLNGQSCRAITKCTTDALFLYIAFAELLVCNNVTVQYVLTGLFFVVDTSQFWLDT